MKMKMKFATGIVLAVISVSAVVAPVFAGDADMCLDCHDPADDWEGMSVVEIIAAAKDTRIRYHVDNRELSEEQLQAIVSRLLKK